MDRAWTWPSGWSSLLSLLLSADIELVNDPTMSAHLTDIAAANNAAWCAAMWRAHGLPVEYGHGLAFCPVETPRFYPNAVSIDPTSAVADQIELIRALADDAPFEFSVKDSFNCLPLDRFGFDRLFEAVWLWRDPVEDGPADPGLVWQKIDSHRLEDWEAAWRGDEDHSKRIFPDALLQDCRVSVVAGYDAKKRIAAGMIAYEASGAIGITNLFGEVLPPSSVVAAMSRLPTVGYEHGRALANALRNGFAEIGSLKVWSKPGQLENSPFQVSGTSLEV